MILLDTNIVIWLASGDDNLSPAAADAIRRARCEGETIAICDATLYELAFLAFRNRIHITTSVEAFLLELEERYKVLAITARACILAMTLGPRFPNDPADRIIAGTALAEGAPLITADRAILRSRALRTIW